MTAKPRHAIGQRGASPWVSNPATIEGFQNLVSWYGEFVYPLLNSAADSAVLRGTTAVTDWLGSYTYLGTDFVDVAAQALYMTIVQASLSATALSTLLDLNGEFVPPGTSLGGPGWTVANQIFTVAGTVTLTNGSNHAVGAGTGWTTTILAQTGHPAAPNIVPGDVLLVEDATTKWTAFRIVSVNSDTSLTIYPTPHTPNPAIGSGLTYKILRTGYNSNSRAEAIPVQTSNLVGSTQNVYYYYAGLRGYTGQVVDQGTIMAITDGGGGLVHTMAPKTVDSSGTTTGVDPIANDVIYYKGFLLYAAGPAISWSIAGFPSALPFGATDFPAKNVSVVAPNDTFISFERLGDQVIAIFQNSQWLVTPTGSVPEFAFYKLPEIEPCYDMALLDVAINVFNHSRPSASGRGCYYFVSNRGIEMSTGGIANETSASIATSIPNVLGTGPLALSWDDSADGLIVRQGLGSSVQTQLYFNARLSEWSTLHYVTSSGSNLAALTGAIDSLPQTSERLRDVHHAYYELVNGAVPGTNGGTIRHVVAGLDTNTVTQGFATWEWLTPVIDTGGEYANFSTGGFILDGFSLNSPPVNIVWTAYGGTSPYNLAQQDSGTLTLDPTQPVLTPWVNDNTSRTGKKLDNRFLMFKFVSSYWFAMYQLTIFPSSTAVKR